MREAFALQKLSYFQQINWHIWDINVWNFNVSLTNDVVSFEQPGPGVLDHSDHLKINLNPSRIYTGFEMTFSETTAPMVLKFHMQNAGLQNDKIQPGWESKMAANAKNSKTNKINFFFRMAWYIRIWLKFCLEHY